MVTSQPVPVSGCEFVPDAYEAILRAEKEGLLLVRRYKEMPEGMLSWIDATIKREYEQSAGIPTYRHFLNNKFPEILGAGGGNA